MTTHQITLMFGRYSGLSPKVRVTRVVQTSRLPYGAEARVKSARNADETFFGFLRDRDGWAFSQTADEFRTQRSDWKRNIVPLTTPKEISLCLVFFPSAGEAQLEFFSNPHQAKERIEQKIFWDVLSQWDRQYPAADKPGDKNNLWEHGVIGLVPDSIKIHDVYKILEKQRISQERKIDWAWSQFYQPPHFNPEVHQWWIYGRMPEYSCLYSKLSGEWVAKLGACLVRPELVAKIHPELKGLEVKTVRSFFHEALNTCWQFIDVLALEPPGLPKNLKDAYDKKNSLTTPLGRSFQELWSFTTRRLQKTDLVVNQPFSEEEENFLTQEEKEFLEQQFGCSVSDVQILQALFIFARMLDRRALALSSMVTFDRIRPE